MISFIWNNKYVKKIKGNYKYMVDWHCFMQSKLLKVRYWQKNSYAIEKSPEVNTNIYGHLVHE